MILTKALVAVVLAFLIWSGIKPYDRLTWFLEVGPVFIGMPLLLLAKKKYDVTSLLMVLLAGHAILLCTGGKYTYARVPIGFYFQELFNLSRNHYDRFGHLAQGFIPAILFREWLIRMRLIPSKKLLVAVIIAFCLSFSVFYEFLEWWIALATGEAAESFLATQGDVWDTQWDMFLALLGCVTSLLLLSRWHDRQINQLKN